MKPISSIDPSTNQLFFRGINVTELCTSSSFEATLYLLIYGRQPSREEEIMTTQRLIELRQFYDEDIDSLFDLAGRLEKIGKENNLNLHDTLLTFVSLAPLVVAHEFSINEGKKVHEQDRNLAHAANFLWMTKGFISNESDLKDFETSLILHMDDPQNPSLSSLMANISEGKTTSDALLSALSVHTGPLHHGAGAEAMKMFEEMRERTDIRDCLIGRLNSDEKIYGLGHRIYTGIDPRALVLRQILIRKVAKTNYQWLLHTADAVAREGRFLLSEYKGIDAYPNVDLYNAAVYSTFGFPPELNTSLFAVSRSAGWVAHLAEYFKSH